jgi:hypothetical protein
VHNCDICGNQNADIQCSKCGRIVCKYCYFDLDGACINCVRKQTLHKKFATFSSSIPSSRLNSLGLLLMVLGILIVSISFTPEEGDDIAPFFPLNTSNMSRVISSILSVALLSLFVIMLVLPRNIFEKRRRFKRHFDVFSWNTHPRTSEEIEYMITIKIPSGIENTVYVDEGEMGVIRIYSHIDSTFYRSYDLPSGYEVEGYTFEYDGDYLVIKLKLKNFSDLF